MGARRSAWEEEEVVLLLRGLPPRMVLSRCALLLVAEPSPRGERVSHRREEGGGEGEAGGGGEEEGARHGVLECWPLFASNG